MVSEPKHQLDVREGGGVLAATSVVIFIVLCPRTPAVLAVLADVVIHANHAAIAVPSNLFAQFLA
jgi:hypothetical protein